MARYAIYVCGGPSDVRVIPRASCPDASKHTPCPERYLEWHEWAETMIKTHRQTQCSTCRYWVIWVLTNRTGMRRVTKIKKAA